MNLNFVVTNAEDPYLLKFTLENTSASFANSIRRTIISEVDTAGFDTKTSLHLVFVLSKTPVDFIMNFFSIGLA